MKSKEIVNWWLEEGCSSMDVNQLLIKQGELASYSFYLAEYVGQKHTDYIMKEHNRKVAYNNDLDDQLKEGSTKGAAEVGAFLRTAEMRVEEKVSEIAYTDSKLLLGQVNKVLEAFTMRISYLKKEMEQANKVEQ